MSEEPKKEIQLVYIPVTPEESARLDSFKSDDETAVEMRRLGKENMFLYRKLQNLEKIKTLKRDNEQLKAKIAMYEADNSS